MTGSTPSQPPTPASGSGRDPTLPTSADRAPEPIDRLFEVDHLQRDLRGRAVRGGAVTMAAQGLSLVLRLAGLAVLARFFLGPADFGLVYKVLPLVGFVALFREAGLSTATIQREHVTHAQVSTLFWVNLALSAAAAAAVAALAPVMGLIYQDPLVPPIALALAGNAFLSGATIQHQALLRRQMRFTVQNVIGVAGIAVGFGSAIVAAWVFDAGYWALVVHQYAGTAFRLIALPWATGWRPSLPRFGTGVRPMLRFGGNLTGSQLLTYLRRNADDVLIGAVAGSGPLGLYNMAYRLLMMPIQSINGPISSVAIPTLSRLQDQPERFARYYYRAIGAITAIGMPIVGFFFVAAEDLILLLLGPDWLDAALIYRILAPVAFLGTFNVAEGWAYTTLGRTERQLRWDVLTTLVVVLGFLLGLPWGEVGVALSFTVIVTCLKGPGLWYCYRGTTLRLSGLAAAVAYPAIGSTFAAGTVLAARSGVNIGVPMWAGLAGLGVLYFVAYLVVWLPLPSGRNKLKEYYRAVDGLRGDKGASVLAEGQP